MRFPGILSLMRGSVLLAFAQLAQAGQVPGAVAARDIPISHRDRVYAAE
jgi:hypothetical protein